MSATDCHLMARAVICASLAVAAILVSPGVFAQAKPPPSNRPPVSDRRLWEASRPEWEPPAPTPRSGFEAENRIRIAELKEQERQFGEDNPALVPAILRLAEWYHGTNQWALARREYRRAISIMERANGEDDPGLAQPLIYIAFTYLSEHNYRSEGREALERVLRLYGNAGQDYARDSADILILLGDWHLYAKDRQNATARYADAWQLLTALEQGSTATAESLLGEARRITYPAAPLADTGDAANASDRPCFVNFRFTVTEDGSVRDLSVTASNLSTDAQRLVRLATLDSRYRPALVEGRTVASSKELVWRFTDGCEAGSPVGDF